MASVDKIKLITRICRLYYYERLGQKEIAEMLNISRSYISKLLKDAEDMGIVRIEIVGDLDDETALEAKVREKFGLRKAIIIPSQTDDHNQKIDILGSHLNRYLSSIIQDGDIIGVSWGRTMYQCSRRLVARDAKDIIVTQLNGGAHSTSPKHVIHIDDVIDRFSKAYGASPFYLRAPTFVDTAGIRDAICADMGIRRTLEMGLKSNILVLAVGEFNMQSSLVRLGDFTVSSIQNLISRGVVGDILSHLIDCDGNVVRTEYEDRTITIPVEEMKRKPYRILVYVQRESTQVLRAVLKGGFANVLLTDEKSALNALA